MRLRYRILVDPVNTIRALWYHYRGAAYDVWHGVETRKLNPESAYGPAKENDGARYDPTEPKYISWAVRNLPIDPREYAFVDFGSGKGRVLIAAAQRPFLKVVGVEYSKELHEAALRNIRSAKRLRCRNITCLCMDAAEFSIPDAPCVLFFYNPFGNATMDRVLS